MDKCGFRFETLMAQLKIKQKIIIKKYRSLHLFGNYDTKFACIYNTSSDLHHML